MSLAHQGLELIPMCGVDIVPMAFKDIPDTDWLFFYSANGISIYNSGISDQQRASVKSKKIGVMGETSAKMVDTLWNKQPDFIATGKNDADTAVFQKLTKDQTVLFIKGEISKNRFFEAKNTAHFSLTVYKNSPKKKLIMPSAEIYIFTSPLNVKAFLENNAIPESALLIAIGQSTREKLAAITGRKNILMPSSPSENAIKELILTL